MTNSGCRFLKRLLQNELQLGHTKTLEDLGWADALLLVRFLFLQVGLLGSWEGAEPLDLLTTAVTKELTSYLTNRLIH